jgi:hypothetical protein
MIARVVSASIFHLVRFVANQHVPFIFRNRPDDRGISRRVIADNLVMRGRVNSVFHAQASRKPSRSELSTIPGSYRPIGAARTPDR